MAAMALAALLLTGSCGQYAGVHDTATIELQGNEEPDAGRRPVPTAWAPPSDPDDLAVLASPNGENTGPSESVRYTVVEVSTKASGSPRPRGDGPLYLCPIQGKGFYSNDWGAPRYSGGYHPHAGNDIFADLHTPIVAPFDGTAVATPNFLGGLSVKVFGRDGFVYNAHLVRYGKLGSVKTGEVIGYVGNTGNALGGPPHNHFEWHPGNGPAVNPYPYLSEVC